MGGKSDSGGQAPYHNFDRVNSVSSASLDKICLKRKSPSLFKNQALTRYCNQSCVTGQAALPIILFISGIIIEIAIAGAFVTFFSGASIYGERLSARALAAAEAGIRDAQMKIVRNKGLGATSYSLPVGVDSTSVIVAQTVDNPNNLYIYTISSTGTALSRQKKLVATLVVSQITGLAKLQSLVEQSIQ